MAGKDRTFIECTHAGREALRRLRKISNTAMFQHAEIAILEYEQRYNAMRVRKDREHQKRQDELKEFQANHCKSAEA